MDSLDTKMNEYLEKYNMGSLDQASKEYFSGVVKIALNEYDLSVPEMANKFQVPDSTVLRWASGVAVPHPKFRQRILDYIAEKI